jgi:hypothetical protein
MENNKIPGTVENWENCKLVNKQYSEFYPVDGVK